MGVGISIFVLSLVVVIMIIPTVNAYTEKQEIELARLLVEYGLKEPDEGGPPEEELIDFQQLRLDEIRDLEYGILELNKVIDIKKTDIQNQNKVIQIEINKIAVAKEKTKKEWGSPPVDTRQLQVEYKKLNVINNELGELVENKRLIEKQIETKKLIYEIQKHDAKLIGIELSANCISMAKSNMTGCPTYEDLHSFDNSLTTTSGGFSFYDGYFHREKSNYQDSYRAYDNDDTIRIIIDPPQNESIRIKMITIEPNLGLFSSAYSKELVDEKRFLIKDRIIKDCYTAKISADNWELLLHDTIFTFQNGCESAEINDIVEYDMPKSNIDVWSSPNVQYQHWLQEMKQLCKVKC